ncbi:L-alanine exporter AlaE [Escherichia coli]|nr:L-alanine exporter AlaE [Escherichia coli]EIS6291636.1 L-alanine exporter AlaE [Escherichia coli]EJC1773137.1 L-alanine exporter AlaE [Escherichia coli]EJC5700670.1 L-alanine exporter AlaE [Escherichia coli]EJC9957750.1 L-alanine exporter AlaE [Escherichia coli]
MFSPQSRLRHAVADTFAMVVYCSVVNMCIEVFLSGMSFEQSFYSRLVAIPVNILIAWPYGMYRDLFMRAARKVSPSGWIKNLADILAYVTFQSPVYVAILLVVGADWHQIMAAVSSNIVVSMLMGAVYGYFLDYCRRLFKVSRYQQVKACPFFSRLASPVASLTGFAK